MTSKQSGKLSDHFSLEELTVTNTNYPNTPDAESLENLKLLCTVLERIRTLLEKPLTVSSGYRSTAVNKAVRGAMSSSHLYGLAADIKVMGMTPYQVCLALKDSNISLDQLIYENLGGNGGWTHVGIKNPLSQNRNQHFSIHKGTGYLQGIVEAPTFN